METETGFGNGSLQELKQNSTLEYPQVVIEISAAEMAQLKELRSDKLVETIQRYAGSKRTVLEVDQYIKEI